MLSDATRFRRTACGLCLIAAPLLLLLSDLLGARGPTDQGGYLDVIAERPVAEAAAIVLAFCGFALTVPAVVGIVHLLRHRAVALGHVGGALAIVGTVSFAFVAGTEFVNVAAADPAADRQEMLALNERVGTSVVYNLLNTTELIGWIFGFILLAAALFRARVVPRAIPVLLVAGTIVRLVGAASLATVVLGDALFLVALGYVGLAVLQQPDREWERPPERT